MLKKLRNYLKSFWKYYLLRKLKLILTIILTIAIYIWIANIINNLPQIYNTELKYILAQVRGGLYLLFIKPIFIYISGLIIIKKI